MNLSTPVVMGIVNLTDDSFYDGGKYNCLESAKRRIEEIVCQKADIIDLGACSTRPGAELVPVEEEIRRLIPAIRFVKSEFPNVPISIDTVWSEVCIAAINEGADIINDISGGSFDEKMFDTVASLQVPYILTHTPAKPDCMQKSTNYNNLFMDICKYFSERLERLRILGAKDIVLDLGFGFGKTIEQNYELLSRQKEFEIFNLPILTGISRKSMIYKPLDKTPEEVLNETSFLHAFALQNGANILRVHDVAIAKNCIKLFNLYNTNSK
ncbi:MAG: dihydropteroate synthase [Bacteroidales bacterium]|jgi:dihydropteroate synthase|nr:dihydropteroate synthase [Bacteroidales bacterium]